MTTDILKQSGIYCIRNILNGKRYVGSACKLWQRKALHFRQLHAAEHHSRKLQRAWNKYGGRSFVFEVLEVVERREDLIAREQHWIDLYNAASRAGYNIAPLAGSSLGVKLTKEQCKAISQRQTGFKHSEETKRKISAITKGRVYSEEIRRNASIRMKGKPPSEAARNASIKAKTGKKQSPEHVAARMKNQVGRICSTETRAKIGLANAAKIHTQEQLERFAKLNIGRKWSEEAIEKRAAKLRGVKMADGVGKKRWETRRARYGENGHK